MRPVLYLFPLLLPCLLLAACGTLSSPRAEFREAEQGFVRSLRWGDYQQASHFLEGPYAERFRERFASLEDLRITGVQADSQATGGDPRRMETRLAIDYYQLPSLTLQGRRLSVKWLYQGGDRWHPGQWRLVGPFPSFP